MKKFLLLLSLFLSLNASAQTAATPPTEESTAEISKLREGLMDSFQKADVDRLLSYLDANVVVTWQNGEVCKGKEEVRAFYHRMMTGDKKVVREITSAPEVLGRHVYGDWAVSWGNLHDHFVLTDGSDLPLNSVFTATVAKRGDTWLLTSFHASVNAFDNPVLKAAVSKTALYTGLIAGVAGLMLGVVAASFWRRRGAKAA